MKLKNGDIVWAKIPVNAEIVRVNKRFGYTLRVRENTDTSYFGDDEVQLVRKSPAKKEKAK
jgi:hypothetical protein